MFHSPRLSSWFTILSLYCQIVLTSDSESGILNPVNPMSLSDHPPEAPVLWRAWPADSPAEDGSGAPAVPVVRQHWFAARAEAERLLGLHRDQIRVQRTGRAA